MTVTRLLAMLAFVGLLAWPASAQERFSFVVATPRPDEERIPTAKPVSMLAGPQLDPLAGGRSTSGRFTVLGVEDIRYDRRDGRQTRQTELLMNVAHTSALAFAIGSGVRHEGVGTNVLLTRVGLMAGSTTNRLVTNVVFERPLSGARDRLDVMTTAGWHRRISRRVDLGVEGLAKDLEELWDPHESDGGARLFLGPSLGLGDREQPWAFHITAGADIRASHSDVVPRGSGKSSLAMQVAATYGFR
jgi:hypothetical protein